MTRTPLVEYQERFIIRMIKQGNCIKHSDYYFRRASKTFLVYCQLLALSRHNRKVIGSINHWVNKTQARAFVTEENAKNLRVHYLDDLIHLLRLPDPSKRIIVPISNDVTNSKTNTKNRKSHRAAKRSVRAFKKKSLITNSSTRRVWVTFCQGGAPGLGKRR